MRVRSLALTVLAAGLAALALSATPASAALPAEFGSEGEAAGQFSEPEGVAVDNCRTGLGEPCSKLEDPSVGDLYVADKSNNRVDKFSAEGTFLLAWGWGVVDGKEELQVCGPGAPSPTVTCRKGLRGAGAGEFRRASGVAVDDAPGLDQGVVYVEDVGNERVQVFEPDGRFVSMFGGEVNKGTKGNLCLAGEDCGEGVEATSPVPGEFGELSANAIAVDSAGTVYVGDGFEALGRVQEFGEGGTSAGETSLPGAGSVTALAVSGANDLYVAARDLQGVHEYETSGAEVGKPRDPSVESYGTAIALGPAGELFLANRGTRHVDEFEAGGEGELESFDPRPVEEPVEGLAFGDGVGELYVLNPYRVRLVGVPPEGPLVESEQAVAEPQGAVTVRASIDPEGARTKYHLDYGTEVAHESETAPAETAPIAKAGEGFEGETVEVKLTGLTPATTYHFHFVAENTKGTPPPPADRTFTTLPAAGIESESVSQVTATSARLSTEAQPAGAGNRIPLRISHRNCLSGESRAWCRTFHRRCAGSRNRRERGIE